MSKFLVLLTVAVIVVYFVAKALARKRRERTPTPSVEPMVPCAHCRVNLPRSEAIERDGRFYCSEEHRRLAGG